MSRETHGALSEAPEETAWRVLGGFGNCHWASLEEGRAGWRITQWNASAEGL